MPDEWLTDEEVAFRLFQSARSKHERRNLEFDLKYNDVLRQVRKGVCAQTGLPFDMRAQLRGELARPFRASLDRIDNHRGYLPDNIQVVSKIYNTAKFCWAAADALKMARALVEQNERRQEEIVRKYLGHKQGDLL